MVDDRKPVPLLDSRHSILATERGISVNKSL